MAEGAELTLEERYVASMVLSGVGDAMGYMNGNWEFCTSGKTIHRECQQLGGVGKLKIEGKWLFCFNILLLSCLISARSN